MATREMPSREPAGKNQIDVRDERLLPPPLSPTLSPPRSLFSLVPFYQRASRTGHTTCSRLTSEIPPRRVGFRSVSLSVSGLAAKSFPLSRAPHSRPSARWSRTPRGSRWRTSHYYLAEPGSYTMQPGSVLRDAVLRSLSVIFKR